MIADYPILMNSRTARAIDLFAKKPAQFVWLCGSVGAGKHYLARYLAAKLLGFKTVAELDSFPFYKAITKLDKQSEIPIETVRQIIRDSRLSLPGDKAVRQVVVVENAHQLSLPAQNALLKTLEEPAPATVFIITAPDNQYLLETIKSRAQKISVWPVDNRKAIDFFGQTYSQDQITKAWLISRGDVGSMTALLKNQEHPMRQAINVAKQLVNQSPLERISTLETETDEFVDILLGLDRVFRVLQIAAINNSDNRSSAYWQSRRQLIDELTIDALTQANPKLLKLQLAVNL